MNLAVKISNLNVYFAKQQILDDINLTASNRSITVLFGHSGSGKTTLLRSLNRLNETSSDYSIKGKIELDLGQGLEDILAKNARAVTEIRKLVGMVFQMPNVLPMSIERNLALPLQVVANLEPAEVRERIQASLSAVHLWQEVKDRLHLPASNLSGGQQQRLCLARTLSLRPAILLLDEPTASLDVQNAHEIEELLLNLAKEYPLIVVSHNPAQALHLADQLIVMAKGKIIHKFRDAELKNLQAETLVKLLE